MRIEYYKNKLWRGEKSKQLTAIYKAWPHHPAYFVHSSFKVQKHARTAKIKSWSWCKHFPKPLILPRPLQILLAAACGSPVLADPPASQTFTMTRWWSKSSMFVHVAGFTKGQRHRCPTGRLPCVNNALEMLSKHIWICTQHQPLFCHEGGKKNTYLDRTTEMFDQSDVFPFGDKQTHGLSTQVTLCFGWLVRVKTYFEWSQAVFISHSPPQKHLFLFFPRYLRAEHAALLRNQNPK